MSVRPDGDQSGLLAAEADVDVYGPGDFEPIVRTWLPIAFAMNSVNRCMGQTDLYPFVLSAAVEKKLGFIHWLVHDHRTRTGA
jgi:hypothetical protein